MDLWEKQLRVDRLRNEKKIPSFSSTLLEAIYRSIDEGDTEIVSKKQGNNRSSSNGSVRGGNSMKEEEEARRESLRRASLIEKWIEMEVSEKVAVREKLHNDRASLVSNSTSNSSDSSCRGYFSSTEADSVSNIRSKSRSLISTLKPIRTSASVRPERSEIPLHFEQRKSNIFDTHLGRKNSSPQQKPRHENGAFVKTKSRALKIYGNLTKMKQPISPGSRLASFLNSLFNAGNAKKEKISRSIGTGSEDTKPERKPKSEQASTCSSVSSFSRSCLSKTPSSTSGIKRSVRFYPVTVIVDEDCRPCGHRFLYEDEPGLMAITTSTKIRESPPILCNEELNFHLMEKNWRLKEPSRDHFKGYQKKSDYEIRDRIRVNYFDDVEDEDHDDDAASYSSSDLFELDTLGGTSIERYREELPVYETTHLDTNRAIASGLIL